jgi:hypothetical protein
LWRSSIALGLTAASSSLLIIWSLTRAVIEPANNALYYLRIGYHAGYRDAAESKQARMYALPSPRHENATTRGTGTMP